MAIDNTGVSWFNNCHWVCSNSDINMDGYEMTGRVNGFYLKLIHERLKGGKVLTVDQIALNSGASHKMMKDRLSRYARQGRVYRVARNQYALDPHAIPVITPDKPKTKAEKKHEAKENTNIMYSCFHKMVRCK